MTLAFERTAVLALEEVGEPKQRIPCAWTKEQAQEQLRVAERVHLESLRGLSLDNPLPHPFVRQANHFFYQIARSTGYSEAEWREIQARFRREFQANLVGILADRKLAASFKPFTEWLKTGTRQHAILSVLDRHAERQRRLFDEMPVFNVEPFSLRQVYIEMDCGVLDWGQIRPDGASTWAGTNKRLDAFEEKNGGRQPLLETVLELLGDRHYDDAIVIQGVAGSGKSSFTRRLSAHLLADGMRPIRVRIRDLQLDVPLLEDIEQAVQNDREIEGDDADLVAPGSKVNDLFDGGRLFDDSVKFRGARISPVVLIMDGWDEVLSTNDTFTKRVERLLDRIRREILVRNNPKVRVVLTGRPSDAVGGSGFLRRSTRILTIRPYSQKQFSRYVERLFKAAADPLSQSDEARWKAESLGSFRRIAENYSPENMQLEVLGLPLLAHLALFVLTSYEGDIAALVQSPTTLYRELTNLTIEKSGKAKQGSDSVEQSYVFRDNELRELLHLTAISITAHGLENISFDELNERLKRLGFRGDLDRAAAAASDDHPLTKLVISYYFKGGHRDLGCEFLHKSFREYFFAEAVVGILKWYAREQPQTPPERLEVEREREFDPNSDRRYELTRKLGLAVSANWLTPEVKTYLRDLLEWEIGCAMGISSVRSPDGSGNLTLDDWSRIREALAETWEWWRNGAHLRPRTSRSLGGVVQEPLFVVELANWGGRLDLRDVIRVDQPRVVTPDASLGDALFDIVGAVHSLCAKAGAPSGLRRRYQAGDLAEGRPRRFAPAGVGVAPSQTRFFEYISRINARGGRPLGPFPRGADLSSGVLNQADLSGSDLRGIILRNADLTEADLSGARLNGADLRSAILSGVNLSDADLRDADLRGADLTGADLSHAVFSGVDLNFAIVTEEQIADALTTKGALGLP